MPKSAKSDKAVLVHNVEQRDINMVHFSTVNIIERVPRVNYPENQAIVFCFGEGCFSSQKETVWWYAIWMIRRLRPGTELEN